MAWEEDSRQGGQGCAGCLGSPQEVRLSTREAGVTNMSMPELRVQCPLCSRQSSSVLMVMTHPCEYDRNSLNLEMIWNVFFRMETSYFLGKGGKFTLSKHFSSFFISV